MIYYTEVPLTSFPRKFSRDFKDTYLYPPLTTVYGMLLSFIGEVDKSAYSIDCLGIGMISQPEVSVILRKQRASKYAPGGAEYHNRVKKYGHKYPAQLHNRPNFLQVLSDCRFVVAISDADLRTRLDEAIKGNVTRFGILSLGESWAMVNVLRPYRESDGEIHWLPPNYNN